MDPVAEGIVGGRYQLKKQLGEGGMASVWMAHDLEKHTDVALKFMSPEFASSEQARVRFEREAFAPMQLKSPYIVEIHGYGVEGTTPFIVMEMLEGEDLLKRIRREGRMPLPAAGKLLTQIAEGLNLTHKAGIIHRDLKPANIFVTRVGSEEIPKIVDFGIAKAKHDGSVDEATKTGVILGSFNYISPEQLQSSKDVDHRSDLWSLAVILLRLITGKMPFPGNDYAELVAKICTAPVPVPSELAPELKLPIGLDAFFRRAFERDKTRRFQTARDMAEQFNRAFRGLPEDPHNSTEPLEQDESYSRERPSGAEAEELARDAQRLSSALRKVPVDLPESQTHALEISDGQMLQVVYHGSGRASPEAPTRNVSAVAAKTREITVVEPSTDDTNEELVSTHLKIDVDLSSSVVGPSSDRRRKMVEAPQTSRRDVEAERRRMRRRSVAIFLFTVVMVVAVSIAAVVAWMYPQRQSDSPSTGAAPGSSP